MTHYVASQEALSLNDMVERIGQFTESIKDLFKNEETSNQIIGDNQIVDHRRVRRELKKASYSDLRLIRVDVPSGMSVTYLDYLDAMEQAVAICEGLMENILGPFSRWLAIGLSDPSTLSNLSNARRVEGFKPHEIDRVTLALGKQFKPGSGVHQRKFGDAFDRLGDVDVVYKRSSDLVSRYVNVSRKEVLSRVKEITQHLDLLLTRIQEDEDNYQTSKVSRELLSKLTYTMAQEVEFYGVVGYQLTVLSTSLNKISDRFTD